MTPTNLTPATDPAQVPSHAESFIRHARKRIAYNQRLADTTEFVEVRAECLAEVKRYKALIGGAA